VFFKETEKAKWLKYNRRTYCLSRNTDERAEKKKR